MSVDAVFFDQDGVIVDTERHGHRVAFNQAFAEFGLDVHWGEDDYHTLLQIGGGKERISHHLQSTGGVLDSKTDVDQLVADLHRRKTDLFIELLESGRLPLRPGVHRLMKSLNEAKVPVGICTTSNERAADAIRRTLLAEIQFAFVLAGDVVPAKKPDPAIYRLAHENLDADPAHCVVIEDSCIGSTAAKAAGMKVLATINGYTAQEDMSAADAVVTCLGDPGGEAARRIKGAESIVDENGVVTLESLQNTFA
jgi:HAD superfamily hydrolase (TIGR01509 family)